MFLMLKATEIDYKSLTRSIFYLILLQSGAYIFFERRSEEGMPDNQRNQNAHSQAEKAGKYGTHLTGNYEYFQKGSFECLAERHNNKTQNIVTKG